MTNGDSNGSSGHGSGGDDEAVIEDRPSQSNKMKDACESFIEDDTASVVEFSGGIKRRESRDLIFFSFLFVNFKLLKL